MTQPQLTRKESLSLFVSLSVPFALISYILAIRQSEPTLTQLLWLFTVLVSGVNFGWFCRPAARNAGASRDEAQLMAAGVCVVAAAMVGWRLGVVAPLALLGIFYVARVWDSSHRSALYVGAAFSLVPLLVWVGLVNSISAVAWILAIGVFCLVSGCCVLRECADFASAQGSSRHLLPNQMGLPAAAIFARLLHLLALVCWILFGVVADLSRGYWIALLAACLVMVEQHFRFRSSRAYSIESSGIWAAMIFGWLLLVGVLFDGSALSGKLSTIAHELMAFAANMH